MKIVIFSIITTVLGLEILPYVKPTTIDTELLLTYKSNMVQVHKYNDIKTSELDNNKVVQVISTSSYIFSDEIVDNIFNQQSKPAKSSTKYIEVSYEDAISVSQSQIWARFKNCIPNHSQNRATYKQGWLIDLGSGGNARLDFSNFLGGIGPAFKNELVGSFGIGGSLTCEINAGNHLQIAVLVKSFTIDKVKQREVKFTKFGLKNSKKKGWTLFPKFVLFDKKSLEIACITDPKFLDCS